MFFICTSAMRNPEFDISIIIVTFNNRDIIRRCLSSLSQSLKFYSSQLTVIDNNSTDGTAAILQNPDFWKHLSFANVERIYNPANLGYTKGVNQGLRRSTGRYVLMLNPDIIFEHSPFALLIDELAKEQNIGIISPQLRFLDGRIQPSCRAFPQKKDVLFEFLGLSRLFNKSVFFNAWRMPDFDFRESRDVDQPQGAFLLTRRDVLETVGLLDEAFPMFFSDVDWCRRVIEKGWRVRFVAAVFVYHVRGASVKQKRAHMIVSSHKSFTSYFQKYDMTWYDRFATNIIQFLLLLATPLRLLGHLNQL